MSPRAGSRSAFLLALLGAACADRPTTSTSVTDSDVGSTSDAETALESTGEDAPVPSPRVARFSLGITHACAIEGEALGCWGGNGLGQLGDGTTEARAQAVAPIGVIRPRDVSAGSYHTCAVDGDGAVWCWGDGVNGVLGDGANEEQHTPVQAVGLPPVRSVETEFVHTCALTETGEVWCWGENNQGQLGLGDIFYMSAIPVQVPGITGVAQISVGERHSCARLEAGGLRCWGDNGYGELGDGTRTNRPSPVPVDTCPIIDVDAGSFRTCVVCEDARVQCWGSNTDGHLVGGDEPYALTPTTIAAVEDVVDVSTSYRHACAVDRRGEVWCWGRNKSGELGDGTLDARVVPAPAEGAAGTSAVEARGTWSGAISCVSVADALLRCAGDTSVGHLGTDMTMSTLVFLPVGE